MLKRSDLHEYQNTAVDMIKRVPKCALWVDMGMGKTATVLTAINDMLHIEVSKVLIIAPLRVAHSVYDKEISQWEHLHGLRTQKVLGSLKARKTALQRDADIYIINRENVQWLVEYIHSKWFFDMVVIDESSSFKNPSSKRFRALRKMSSKIERLVELTGTPAPNGYIDLWSQLYLLDSGQRIGRTLTNYRSRFFESDFFGYKYTLKDGADKEIHSKVSDIVLSMKASDYLKMDEPLYIVEDIPLPQGMKKLYSEFEKEMMLTLENDDVITAMTAATLTNKLLQFCSGFVYDGAGEAKHFHTAKIDALKEIIADNPNESMLIAYNYKEELKMLKDNIPELEVLDKQGTAIDRWNNGKIKYLAAHPASAGHGLNLQYGGSMVVWLGFNWSLELYQQFNKRLHRQGQKETVRIVHLAVGEVEYNLMKALSEKDATQSRLLQALRFH